MKKFLKDAKGHIMSGIGYMLPLIIGASLVVAIPKLIGVAMGVNSLDAYATKDGFLHILYLLGFDFTPFSYSNNLFSINLSLHLISVFSLFICIMLINLWLSTVIHSLHPHLLNNDINLYHNNCDELCK